MLPIPPRTAAVKAAIPSRKPIEKFTDSNVIENSTAATPASRPPIANVIVTTRSTLIPMRLAISLSAATARIDFPVRVRAMNSERIATATITVTMTTTWIRSTSRPRIVQVPFRTSGTPNPRFCAPKNPRAVFWRNSEAPIAVMSGTSRGALRSGPIGDPFEQDGDAHRRQHRHGQQDRDRRHRVANRGSRSRS